MVSLFGRGFESHQLHPTIIEVAEQSAASFCFQFNSDQTALNVTELFSIPKCESRWRLFARFSLLTLNVFATFV